MKSVRNAVHALQNSPPGTKSLTALFAALVIVLSCLGIFVPNAEANKNVNVTFAGAAGGKVSNGATTLTASGAISVANNTSGVLTASNNTGTNPPVCGIWSTSAVTGFSGANANTIDYTVGSSDIGPQTVTFTALSITTPPAASQTKTYGQSVSFSVTAVGGGTLSYQWKKGGSVITGATGSTYTISAVQLSDAATNYTVTVTDPCGNSVTSSNAALTVNKASLTVSGVTANDKTYDRSTTATLNTVSAALVGVLGGDTVTLGTGSASGAFADANASLTAKTVTVSGLTIGGASAGNYTLTQPTTSAKINAKGLTVSGITANDKTYDRSATATLNTGSAALVGVLGGDTVTLGTGGASGAFADANASLTAKTVTVSGLTIGGASAGNYTLTQPTTSAKINAAGLTVSGITANDKTYDRSATATLNTGSAALIGVLGGDTVTLTTGSAAGAFADANASLTAKTVTVSGLTLSGASAGNYSLTQPTTSAKINAAGLTVSGVTANNKPYDGSAAASLNTGSAALVGFISGDSVSLVTTGAAGAFADATVANGKTVTVSGLTLSGASAGNYSLTQPTTSADITTRAITVTADAKSKNYLQGDPALTYQITSGSLVGADAFSGALSRVAGENAGSYAIQQNTLALNSNYALTYIGANLTINPLAATVGLVGLSQDWDGDPKVVTANVSPSAAYSVTYDGSLSAPSNPGSYAVVATVTDVNYSGSASGTLVITDKTGPKLDVSMLSDGTTAQPPTINITGLASDVSGIKSVTVNGIAVTQTAGSFNTAWIFNNTGANAITVVATDQADNTTTVTKNITFDQSAPTLSVTAPADGSTTVANFINLAGTIDAGSTVSFTVNGGSPQSASITGTAFTGTANLVAGMNTIEITATDAASRQVSVKRTVVSDSNGLSLQVGQPATDTISHVGSYTVIGSVADYNGDATVAITAGSQTYTPAVVNGAFQQVVALTMDNTQVVVPNVIQVTATDSTGHTSAVTRTINTITATLSLSSTLAPPQAPGALVPIKATATGGTAPYQYQIWLRSGNTWTRKIDYADNTDTWNWDTSGVAAGTYSIIAYVRQAGSTLAYDAVAVMSYSITSGAPANGASLSVSPTNPNQVVKGNTVNLTAGATTNGLVVGPYEYQFWVQPTGGTWTMLQNYSTTNTYAWDTSAVAPATYNLKVSVRNVGSALTSEAVKVLTGYAVLPAAPATAATLTASPLSSQPVGTQITLTAGATTGGSVVGPYQYQFWLQTAGVWAIKQDYSSSTQNTWTWNTNGLVAGNYAVKVCVRNVGSPLACEALKVLGYVLK